MGLNANALSQLKVLANTFGGKVWEEGDTVCTVAPGEYELKVQNMTRKSDGEQFQSRQILIPVGGGEIAAVNLRADEPADDTHTYQVNKYTALRTTDYVVEGEQKAMAVSLGAK